MAMTRTVLETRGLRKTFGGVTAVDDVNFRLEKDDGIRAIIGPNGAGKSTFFNLIIGRLTPTNGRIFFCGEDITGLPPHAISHKGISVSFQITDLFTNLSVFENIRVAVQSRYKRYYHPFIGADMLPGVTSKVEKVCKLVGLQDEMNELAAILSHGDKKLLEIGVSLGQSPILLLLDEPTAGLSAKEVNEITAVIASLRNQLSVVLVEHDMDVVMQLADKISVLDNGRVIAEGSPEEIRRNGEVQRVYLGG